MADQANNSGLPSSLGALEVDGKESKGSNASDDANSEQSNASCVGGGSTSDGRDGWGFIDALPLNAVTDLNDVVFRTIVGIHGRALLEVSSPTRNKVVGVVEAVELNGVGIDNLVVLGSKSGFDDGWVNGEAEVLGVELVGKVVDVGHVWNGDIKLESGGIAHGDGVHQQGRHERVVSLGKVAGDLLEQQETELLKIGVIDLLGILGEDDTVDDGGGSPGGHLGGEDGVQRTIGIVTTTNGSGSNDRENSLQGGGENELVVSVGNVGGMQDAVDGRLGRPCSAIGIRAAQEQADGWVQHDRDEASGNVSQGRESGVAGHDVWDAVVDAVGDGQLDVQRGDGAWEAHDGLLALLGGVAVVVVELVGNTWGWGRGTSGGRRDSGRLRTSKNGAQNVEVDGEHGRSGGGKSARYKNHSKG
jgi:hypothetical protein